MEQRPQKSVATILTVPSLLLERSRAHASDSNTYLKNYIGISHKIFSKIKESGVTSQTRIRGKSDLHVLPPFRNLENPEWAHKPKLTLSLPKNVSIESKEYRADQALSLSKYVTRILFVTDFMYQIEAGPNIHVTDTDAGEIIIATGLNIPGDQGLLPGNNTKTY